MTPGLSPQQQLLTPEGWCRDLPLLAPPGVQDAMGAAIPSGGTGPIPHSLAALPVWAQDHLSAGGSPTPGGPLTTVPDGGVPWGMLHSDRQAREAEGSRVASAL
ncbi:hypothetical protein [Streptomyces sp. NBC_00076]|uniref:hypothetical protein n=1 Tax=Streptomyces sp. NBC_00076 TaxID=2975642 RepID=UPI0032442E20